jgi:secreted Zn-dependent insulinase-like peptidase
MGESQTAREMNAVDSEFNMSQQSDAWRKFMMI